MEKNPIYQFLKSNNLTTKTEEEFIIEYSDRKKSDELFKFMQTNNLTQKTNDEFYSTYFASVKKKVPSSSVGQNQGTMGSTGQPKQAKNVSSVSPSGLVGEDAPEGYVESPAGTKIEQPTKRVGDIVMPVAPATDMPDYGKQYEQAAEIKVADKQIKINKAEDAIKFQTDIAKSYDMELPEYRNYIEKDLAKEFLGESEIEEYNLQQSIDEYVNLSKDLNPNDINNKDIFDKISSLKKDAANLRVQKVNGVVEQIRQIKESIDYTDPTATKEKLEEIKKLRATITPTINPAQYAKEKASTSEVMGMPGDTPMDKLKNYYHSKLYELKKLEEDTGFLDYATGSLPIVGDLTGATKKRDKYRELYQEIKELTPIITINQKDLKEDNFFTQLAKGAVSSLLSENIVTTEQQQAEKLYNAFSDANVMSNVSEEAKQAIDASFDMTLKEEIGSTGGVVLGMMPAFVTGGAAVKGVGGLAKGTKIAEALNKLDKSSKAAKYLIGATETGLSYEAAGLLSTSEVVDEEASFLSGFMGETFVRGLGKLVPQKIYNQTMLKLFGGSANKAQDLLMKGSAKVGSKAGYGFGEVAEEYGNELGNIISESNGDLNEFIKMHSERFGDFDDNVKFGLMTFGMGMAFGTFTNSGKDFMKKHQDWLSEQSPEVQSEFATIAAETQSAVDEISGTDGAVDELTKVQNRINQIESAREQGALLEDEEPGELKKLKEQETQLLSKEEDAPQAIVDEVVIDEEGDIQIGEDELSQLEYDIQQQEDQGTILDNIDQTVYMDGKEGIIKIDPENENTIIFESGNIVRELGNKDEVGGDLLVSAGISLNATEDVVTDEKITTGEEQKSIDTFTLDGKEYNVIGRKRDKKGQAVVRVKEVETGLERRIVGDNAEVILKDEALRRGGRQVAIPEIKVTERVVEPQTETKAQKRERVIAKKKEFEATNQAEFDAAVEQSNKDVAEFEEMVVANLAAEKESNKDLVSVNSQVYQVTKNNDNSFSVSKMRADGKLTRVTDVAERSKAVGQFKRAKTNKEKAKLKEADALLSDFKKEESDKILSLLDRLIDSTNIKGRAFDATLGIPMVTVNASLRIVRAAYKAGKSLAQAIEDGIKYLKENGYAVNELDYKKYVLSEFKKKPYSTPEKEPKLTEKKDTDNTSSLKDAKEPGTRIITKAKEILFKGTQSKTKDGKKFSVHNIKQGRFTALDIKLAMDYKGDKPLKQFSIPAGTTIDVVKLAPEDSKKGITTAREIETAAIDASDAQVVKLLTYDSRGGVSEQYIIKDKSILDSSKDVTDSQLKSKLASLKGRIPTQIKRVFDKVKNIKDITYAEQQDIVDQIMSDQADMAQVSESIMQELVELEGKGKISQKQSNAIVSRMSKLDKLNEGQVARFIDYASKILNDANYKFKVDAVAAKLKKAKLNTPRRLGMNRAGGIVKRLFTMDMSLVPKEVFDKYAELVELMASSSSIIEINKDIDEIAKTAQEVLSVVEVQNGKLETLAQVYQDNKSDKLTYSQNLDKMLVDGIVNINDKEILSKYKSLIDKKPAKKKTEAEIEEEKKELIKGILSERKLETRVFATRAETDLAIQTKKLATKENIDLLSIAQLKTLSKVISNINNGLVDRNTFMLRNRLNANNSIQPVYEATLKAKIGVVANYFHLLKKFGNEKMSSTTSAIRSAIGYNIDAEFGDYKSKDLWENLLERLAIGENLNINKVDTIKAKADKILDKIYKSFYRKENRLVESKAKMFLYKLGLEFKSNPDSDQVKSPEAYLEKTISDGDLDKRTLDMLSDILNDKNLFVDGVLDLDKLYSSFNKYEKEFIALAGKINQEASEYAMFDAGIIQDRPITLLNDYVHHIVIKEDRASEREEATKIAEKINRSMTPTTRAEHLTDREDVVTPLNFDLYNSLISGAKKTYLDYYMTEPIMTSRLVLEGLEAKMRKDGTYKENKDNLQALRNKVEEGISNLLFNNVTSNTLIESISENIATEAYRYMLASGNKLFNELLANFSFVAIYKPADYIDGVAALNKIDMEKFASILINSKSIVTNKLLPKNVLYASRLTEISSSKSGVASKKIKSELSDYSKLVYNQTFKRIKNVAGAINDFTIATSDKIMSIPLWYGSFLSEFNKVSGQNLDVEKFIANDLEYIQKYEKDIELARRYADEVSAEATSIKGAFAGTLAGKNLDREKAGIVKRVYYAYNNFMAGFMQGETDAALKGAKAAVGNGRMSKTDGTRLATAIMARSITYNTLAATTAGGLLYAIYKSLYDLEDDEYEKELSSETMIDATKKAAISMISGKLGNVGKLPINYAAEYLNEKYFYDGLEEDYKNITYLPKPDRKEWETPSVSDWIPAFAAKYGPILTTGNQIYRLYDEEIKLSEKDTDGMKYSKLMELEAKKANIPYKRGMLAISILGQLGYIPAAKNVTKIARREAYRDK